MHLIARILIVVVILPILAFCVLGFLATFEPGNWLAWRIGYALGGFLCLLGIALAIFARSSRAEA
jgi:hypothetical protein